MFPLQIPPHPSQHPAPTSTIAQSRLYQVFKCKSENHLARGMMSKCESSSLAPIAEAEHQQQQQQQQQQLRLEPSPTSSVVFTKSLPDLNMIPKPEKLNVSLANLPNSSSSSSSSNTSACSPVPSTNSVELFKKNSPQHLRRSGHRLLRYQHATTSARPLSTNTLPSHLQVFGVGGRMTLADQRSLGCSMSSLATTATTITTTTGGRREELSRLRYLTFGTSAQLQQEYGKLLPWPAMTEFRFRRRMRRFRRRARRLLTSSTLLDRLQSVKNLLSGGAHKTKAKRNSVDHVAPNMMSRASSLSSLLDLIEEANKNLIDSFNEPSGRAHQPPKCPPRLKRAVSSINVGNAAADGRKPAIPNKPSILKKKTQTLSGAESNLWSTNISDYQIAFIDHRLRANNNNNHNGNNQDDSNNPAEVAAQDKISVKSLESYFGEASLSSGGGQLVKDTDIATKAKGHGGVAASKVLCVRSHFEINNGTVYLEDSDWEMCSEVDFGPDSLKSNKSEADDEDEELGMGRRVDNVEREDDMESTLQANDLVEQKLRELSSVLLNNNNNNNKPQLPNKPDHLMLLAKSSEDLGKTTTVINEAIDGGEENKDLDKKSKQNIEATTTAMDTCDVDKDNGNQQPKERAIKATMNKVATTKDVEDVATTPTTEAGKGSTKVTEAAKTNMVTKKMLTTTTTTIGHAEVLLLVEDDQDNGEPRHDEDIRDAHAATTTPAEKDEARRVKAAICNNDTDEATSNHNGHELAVNEDKSDEEVSNDNDNNYNNNNKPKKVEEEEEEDDRGKVDGAHGETGDDRQKSKSCIEIANESENDSRSNNILTLRQSSSAPAVPVVVVDEAETSKQISAEAESQQKCCMTKGFIIVGETKTISSTGSSSDIIAAAEVAGKTTTTTTTNKIVEDDDDDDDGGSGGGRKHEKSILMSTIEEVAEEEDDDNEKEDKVDKLSPTHETFDHKLFAAKDMCTATTTTTTNIETNDTITPVEQLSQPNTARNIETCKINSKKKMEEVIIDKDNATDRNVRPSQIKQQQEAKWIDLINKIKASNNQKDAAPAITKEVKKVTTTNKVEASNLATTDVNTKPETKDENTNQVRRLIKELNNSAPKLKPVSGNNNIDKNIVNIDKNNNHNNIGASNQGKSTKPKPKAASQKRPAPPPPTTTKSKAKQLIEKFNSKTTSTTTANAPAQQQQQQSQQPGDVFATLLNNNNLDTSPAASFGSVEQHVQNCLRQFYAQQKQSPGEAQPKQASVTPAVVDIDALSDKILTELESKFRNEYQQNRSDMCNNVNNNNWLLLFFLYNQRQMFQDMLHEMLTAINKQQQQQQQTTTSSNHLVTSKKVETNNYEKEVHASLEEFKQFMLKTQQQPQLPLALTSPPPTIKSKSEGGGAGHNENGNSSSSGSSSLSSSTANVQCHASNRFVNKIVLNNSINQFNFSTTTTTTNDPNNQAPVSSPAVTSPPPPTATIVNMFNDQSQKQALNLFEMKLPETAAPKTKGRAPAPSKPEAKTNKTATTATPEPDNSPKTTATSASGVKVSCVNVADTSAISPASSAATVAAKNEPQQQQHRTVLEIKDTTNKFNNSLINVLRYKLERKRNKMLIEKMKRSTSTANLWISLEGTTAGAGKAGKKGQKTKGNDQAAADVTLANTSTLEIRVPRELDELGEDVSEEVKGTTLRKLFFSTPRGSAKTAAAEAEQRHRVKENKFYDDGQEVPVVDNQKKNKKKYKDKDKKKKNADKDQSSKAILEISEPTPMGVESLFGTLNRRDEHRLARSGGMRCLSERNFKSVVNLNQLGLDDYLVTEHHRHQSPQPSEDAEEDYDDYENQTTTVLDRKKLFERFNSRLDDRINSFNEALLRPAPEAATTATLARSKDTGRQRPRYYGSQLNLFKANQQNYRTSRDRWGGHYPGGQFNEYDDETDLEREEDSFDDDDDHDDDGADREDDLVEEEEEDEEVEDEEQDAIDQNKYNMDRLLERRQPVVTFTLPRSFKPKAGARHKSNADHQGDKEVDEDLGSPQYINYSPPPPPCFSSQNNFQTFVKQQERNNNFESYLAPCRLNKRYFEAAQRSQQQQLI